MGNPMDFYFKVLEIPKDSSPQEIRAAYRALVKKWHPDKHPASSKPQAEAKFKAITQAYEALNVQEDSRAMFGFCNDVGDGGGGGGGSRGGGSNRGREAARPSPLPRHRSQEQFPQSGSGRGFKDVYYSMGASSPAARPTFSGSARRKPPPVEHKLECTLEELFRGCKKEIRFTRDVPTKNGLIVQKEERHTIKVKPGWKKGTKITFEGMGDDVVVLISEREHPIFKRVGNDLVLKVEVPLVNALTGWTFSFPLLSGEKMSCSFHDEIIYPGYVKVLKGQGMPLAHEEGVRGDLRVKFHIIFPAKLSDEQRSSIVELLNDCT
ncbi:dnaJ protein homolog 1-like [Phoenix dactylifera]|uniref:DnaJ protein homolog 1-like n=1 Tax=Phoenix dactylifera TaxID=42345 RepID=A0A8B7BQP4_PHODC|nr:dnaJ protein homolog 1-like [Phoenix dactylifera]